MDDEEIIELFFSRSETAIAETRRRYGGLIRHICKNILHNTQDAEECENDTYLGAWRSIPPNRPRNLKAYLAKIARNTACRRAEYLCAGKRDPGTLVSLDELADTIADGRADLRASSELGELLNAFLATLRTDQRQIFLLRYWMMLSVREIMHRTGYSKSKVESTLFRTRNKLRDYLKKEGCYQ